MAALKFCGELDFRIPSGWAELEPREIPVVFKALMSDGFADASEIPVYLLMRLSGIAVVGRTADGVRYLCSQRGKLSALEPIVLASLVEKMQWVLDDPKLPWRPVMLAGRETVDAEMLYITLAEWLRIDDCYTGALYTQNISLVNSLCPILLKKGLGARFEDWECLAVLRWIQGVKALLSDEYPEFFVPAPKMQPDADLKRSLREGVDAQIRALTKGDITKEEEVLNMPLRRALAELNAQAREYREYKQAVKK